VHVTSEGDIPIILGQPTFIGLVLDNLISNADKYSPPGNPIEISVRQNGLRNVEVCVRDYGIGLDDDEAEQVFTPFYRSPRAEAQAKGIGLGLAVCRRVMEAQGGTIRAVTRPEGGCDFIFSVKTYRESDR
jgi:K+-sensing histidine kinase KdpD